MLALRSLFFTLLLPGSVTFLIPYLLLSSGIEPIPSRLEPFRFVGLVPILIGALILLRCIWDFAVAGRGTLAPVDPPTRLVVRGLYRYVRNPMYVGVVSALLGEAWLFASFPLLIYAACTFLVVHLFVVFYEEPSLRRRFGESYEEY